MLVNVLLCLQCLLHRVSAFMSPAPGISRSLPGWRFVVNSHKVSVHSSTVTPTKKPTVPGRIKVPKENPGELFKSSTSIDEEFDEMLNNNNWNVILYNDPINKRAYVQSVLIDVFSWDESKANSVMMQAHTYGLAIAGEWYKELALEYAQQLNRRNLIAEAKPAGNSGSGDGNNDYGELQ